MSIESRVSNAEAAAIEKARRLGEDIAKRFPSIADDYRKLYTRNEIIQMHSLEEMYGPENEKIMKTAVHDALEILIPDSKERVGLAKKIQEKAGKDGYEKRKGIGAFNRKKQKRWGQKSALQKGNLPWSHEEKQTLAELAGDEAYRHKSGSCAGKPDYEKIQTRIYQLYGTRRTIGTLYNRLCKMRKEKN